MIYLTLFYEFFKIGLFAVGGGLALSHSGTYGAEGDGKGGGNSNDGGISHGSVSPYKNILYSFAFKRRAVIRWPPADKWKRAS